MLCDYSLSISITVVSSKCKSGLLLALMASVSSLVFIGTVQVVNHIRNDWIRNHNKGYKIYFDA